MSNVLSWGGLVARVLLAICSGALVGLDREIRGKPAGVRTHVLVSLGACLFVMIPEDIGGSEAASSAARVIQGVAAGVGFLGAGEILRQPTLPTAKERVRG